MRLDIISEDRLGITQELLSVIVKKRWNLAAVEMYTHHTFIHINERGISLDTIKKALFKVDGVKDVALIALLPGEEKRKHLDALLSKLPDPILDIDINGKILVANIGAEKALGVIKEELEGKNLCELVNVRLSQILVEDPPTIDITSRNKHFLMDITPVYTNSKVTGAVIVMRSPERLGKQISAIQPQNGDDIESIIGQSVKIKKVQQQTKRFAK